MKINESWWNWWNHFDWFDVLKAKTKCKNGMIDLFWQKRFQMMSNQNAKILEVTKQGPIQHNCLRHFLTHYHNNLDTYYCQSLQQQFDIYSSEY